MRPWFVLEVSSTMFLPPLARSQYSVPVPVAVQNVMWQKAAMILHTLINMVGMAQPTHCTGEGSVHRTSRTGFNFRTLFRSRVDQTHLESKQARKQATSKRKMGKNHSSIVVLQIGPKICWILPMAVGDDLTKNEPKTQR